IAQRADAPTLTAGTGNTTTFAEGGSPVVVDDALVVADVDSTTLTGATAQVTTGFSTAQGDTLAFTPGNGITGSYAAGTGLLTLSGSSSVANYQAALRSVAFSNTSDAPTSPRTVAFTATDGDATSTAATHPVLLVGVNDAPVLSGGGTLGYTENDAATVISTALVVTDVDSANVTGASVAITANFASGQDVLSFTNTANITGSYNGGTGVLTLSGTDTVAAYQAALRAVRYANSSDAPSTAARTITYSARDNGTPGLSGTTTATVTVTAVNDAPAVMGEADTSVGNTRLAYGFAAGAPAGRAAVRRVVAGNVLTNDTDADGPSALTVNVAASSTNSAEGGTVAWTSSGSFNYDPPIGYTGVDTVLYAVTDGVATTYGSVQIVLSGRVWYVDNIYADGGDGGSTRPFDTLAEADAAANAANDRIYVHEGTGTTTKLTGGVSLLAGQRLTGEARDLVVGSDTLLDTQPADRPTIAGSVTVDDGNTVEGLTIESQAAAAPAIAGGAGDVSGTISDVALTSAAAGSGLTLSGTSGMWVVSDTTISSSGASSTGLNLTNAGNVTLVNTGTVSVTASGGTGVSIAGTALAGTIDAVTTTSVTTGVAITSNTGGLAFGGLSLGATGDALRLDSTNGISIAGGSISAGGTALDVNTDANTTVTAPPAVTLGAVSSGGGTYGIRVDDLGTGTVSATGGTLGGQTTSALRVAGGSGAVTYGGSIANGSGASAQITGRTGGTTSVSGTIIDSADAGGGISVTGNTGGTFTFSGATKTLNTGGSTAVDLSGSGTLDLTGGGLGITTTSGGGLIASGTTATLSVQGAGNTIVSGSGTALSVNGPDFTSGNATFRSISSTGATNGVLLADTGSTGGLRVTGTGTAGTGGAIQGSSGAGISLSNTRDVQLASIDVTNGTDDGIRGTNVNGLSLTASARVTGNGNAVTEHGLDFTELSGTVTLTGLTATGNAEDNVAIVNDAATISNLALDGGTYGSNSATIGNDGFRLENDGTGNTTGSIRNATFSFNRGDHIQITTDNSNAAAQNITVQANVFRGTGNQGGNTSVGGGISVGAGGQASQTVVIDNNDIERPYGSAISLNLAGLTNTATARWTLTNNTIGTVGEALSGSAANSSVYYNVNGNGTANTRIEGNDFRGSAFTAIDLVNNDGDATVNATVRNNVIAEPRVPTPGVPATFTYTYGIRFVLGSDGADNGDGCLDLGSSTPALQNQVFGTGQDGLEDIAVSLNGDDNDLDLVGYAGGLHTDAAVQSYLISRNSKGGTPTVSASQFDTTNSEWRPRATACPQP
ncbi:MAG: Ig-like domain-containing protein, partial [Solirubrobacteraceae bacterium]|nr:Ig-like domain-containing protein [Solirubrobacteraceae bacterium]